MAKEKEVVKEVKEVDELVIGKADEPDEKLSEVEVDLEKKEEKEVKKEPVYVTVDELKAIQKQLNGVSATIRHVKDIPDQIAALKEEISKNRTLTSGEKKEAKDELDEMLEKGDWRTPVERLAERKFKSMMDEKDRVQSEVQARREKLSILESNKKSVLEKYPEIEDSESEVSKIYQRIANENPRYLASEDGPILVMRKMEDELRKDGRLDEFTKEVVSKEVARQTRVGAGAVPRSSAPSTNGKIVLTQEQKRFCDANDVKYENYAKFVKSSKQGVEV